MNGSAYYDYQAKARGLTSSADVDALVELMSPFYHRLVCPWLPNTRSAAIYEIACGPGIMLRFLKELGYTNITGSDSSACQIELAKSAGLAVLLADSREELRTHPNSRWDCLIAIDFVEHLPKDTLIDFFAQSYRTLRPGGRLILRAPNGDSPLAGRNLFNDITHVWAYTTIATQALLQMAGFGRVEFAEESCASIRHHRWLKIPLMKLFQALIRCSIR